MEWCKSYTSAIKANPDIEEQFNFSYHFKENTSVYFMSLTQFYNCFDFWDFRNPFEYFDKQKIIPCPKMLYKSSYNKLDLIEADGRHRALWFSMKFMGQRFPVEIAIIN